MTLFSKLFSSPTKQTLPTLSPNPIYESLQESFKHDAQFYKNSCIILNDTQHTIKLMMMHPHLGIVLFSTFEYGMEELQGVTAAMAKKEDKDADIKIRSEQELIQECMSKGIHSQEIPVHSVLICNELSEDEFDSLDESFHRLIPKRLSLFNDIQNNKTKLLALTDMQRSYDLTQIKTLLFSELVLSLKHTLMSERQEKIIYKELDKNYLVKGLPGSGKSSILISKGLYEKMKRPELSLIIFAQRACNVHNLQALIFKYIENSQWGLNPADITVSTFESIQRRCREKEKYDLIICDDLNGPDLNALEALLSKEGRLLCSSNYEHSSLPMLELEESFRLSPALCAACEGQEVETLSQSLSFEVGNPIMNCILVLTKLLKEVSPKEIGIISYSKELSLQLQDEINDYCNDEAYLFDDIQRQEGLLIHPLSHLSCLSLTYMIVLVDDQSRYDPIELISRAQCKSFILSETEGIYNTLTTIKGLHNEID